MRIFAVSEGRWADRRVSVTPENAKKLTALGHNVFLEEGAGSDAGFRDQEYIDAGATIAGASDIRKADIVFSVNSLTKELVGLLGDHTMLIGQHGKCDDLKMLLEKKITVFALDWIPRTSKAQYMDVLSSQASLAGYKAVIESAHILCRGIPLMMTSAGTVPAARVLVIGAGVAGLQAIATAKRLGAVVSAFDVRTSAKEQVESLGAKFIEVDSTEKMDGVYATETGEDYKKAQETKLRSVLPSQDVVITTAQIPGKKAPIIVKADMVATMKNGSLILDLASKTGGNCELTRHGETIDVNGVKIVAFANILNLIAYDASRLYSKNVCAFFELLAQELQSNGSIADSKDDIIVATLLAYDGKIINNKLEIS
jgi:NAD(P) transhydrogenase subunit alpha